MRRIVLLRHGKSDWDDRYNRDLDRPLAHRGRHDVPRMARWLRGNGFTPATVVSSPARRAKETALLACDAMGLPPGEIAWEDAIYGASAVTLAAVAQAHLARPPLLMVGHNPGFDGFLKAMCGQVPLNPKGKLLTTAAVAVVEVPDSGPLIGQGRLVVLKRPKEL